jgi:hypothetical protein
MTAAMSVGLIMKMAMEGAQAPGLNYGLDRILHGEQYTEVVRPLPPKQKLEHRAQGEGHLRQGQGRRRGDGDRHHDEAPATCSAATR